MITATVIGPGQMWMWTRTCWLGREHSESPRVLVTVHRKWMANGHLGHFPSMYWSPSGPLVPLLLELLFRLLAARPSSAILVTDKIDKVSVSYLTSLARRSEQWLTRSHWRLLEHVAPDKPYRSFHEEGKIWLEQKRNRITLLSPKTTPCLFTALVSGLAEGGRHRHRDTAALPPTWQRAPIPIKLIVAGTGFAERFQPMFSACLIIS